MGEVTLQPGTVFWAAPDPTVGVEQAGRRPFIVVASSAYLATVTHLVLAVPVTTVDRAWPNHVELHGNTALGEKCFAMTEQIRAISRKRITKFAGEVDSSTLKNIVEWIDLFLVSTPNE
ncbi:MAG: type II toxin-antitoxin system PemK/MazF family toxin [Cellulomonadaceae bacterium]|jgi:mRNA interferase MazF|nr:type II toxin-antitoxin system PemK/MazF family toxin [Cellulomonadaceae bacterium]